MIMSYAKAVGTPISIRKNPLNRPVKKPSSKPSKGQLKRRRKATAKQRQALHDADERETTRSNFGGLDIRSSYKDEKRDSMRSRRKTKGSYVVKAKEHRQRCIKRTTKCKSAIEWWNMLSTKDQTDVSIISDVDINELIERAHREVKSNDPDEELDSEIKSNQCYMKACTALIRVHDMYKSSKTPNISKSRNRRMKRRTNKKIKEAEAEMRRLKEIEQITEERNKRALAARTRADLLRQQKEKAEFELAYFRRLANLMPDTITGDDFLYNKHNKTMNMRKALIDQMRTEGMSFEDINDVLDSETTYNSVDFEEYKDITLIDHNKERIDEYNRLAAHHNKEVQKERALRESARLARERKEAKDYALGWRKVGRKRKSKPVQQFGRMVPLIDTSHEISSEEVEMLHDDLLDLIYETESEDEEPTSDEELYDFDEEEEEYWRKHA